MIDGERAEIDVSVDAGRRGKGYGSLLIEAAVEQVFATTTLRSAEAFIRPGNIGSISAFEKANFIKEPVRGNRAVHYVRVR